jgi:arylsulfatase A-like enzyme
LNPTRFRERFRLLLWGLIVSGYFIVFCKTVSQWSSWRQALVLSALASPVLIGTSIGVLRKGANSPPVLLWASGCVALTLCGLRLADTVWQEIPEEKQLSAAVGLAGLVGVATFVLAWLARAVPRDQPFEPVWRVQGLITVTAFLSFGLSVAVLSGPSLLFVQEDPQPAVAHPSGPNFLLIVLDTVRADHLDLFGYQRETMPNLRRFAKEECQAAIRMNTTAPWTVPSHASMFTGLYASAHGAHSPFAHEENPQAYAYSIADDVPTLAEYLSGFGYQTGEIVSNYGGLSGLGLTRGFAYRDISPRLPTLASSLTWLDTFRLGDWRSIGNLLRRRLPVSWQYRSEIFSTYEPPYRRARQITTRAQHWLDRHGERPFFLFLNYLDAHTPYVPIAEDDERFGQRPRAGGWLTFPWERYLASVRQEAQFSADETEFLKAQYDAELFSLDREFGRLVDYLREERYFEDTVIFVTTDHGESFFEHGFLEHGNALYQPEIGGFLLAKVPPSLGAVEPSSSMQFVDFFPTFATILRQHVPPHVQGTPWGTGREFALSEVFCKACRREFGGRGQWPDSLRRDLVAVTVDDQKLIRSTRDPDEVYDLRNDPGEAEPLAAPKADFLQRVETVIAERNQRLVNRLTDKAPFDKKLLERLRSLGYVQ